jgi:sugar phosphate permease
MSDQPRGADDASATDGEADRPTRVRHAVIAISVAMAFILYLDRICLGEIVKSASFKGDIPLSKEQIGTILGSFFLAYALFQVPSGWASDRFGARVMLTIYIVGWSAMTAVTGLAQGFSGLLLARLGCGIFEAGAYPTCNALIRRWAPFSRRARVSGLVTFGGRIGGALAPVLTAWMIVRFGSWRPALLVDGLVGLVIAAFWWRIIRDRPADHPRCNAAEVALLPTTAGETPPSVGMLMRILGAACRNRSIWLACLAQTAVNVGWAFLVSWLPTYLGEVHAVEPIEGGKMVTLVLACGMIGMLCGGPFCDWTTGLLGHRWGRVAPVVVGATLAGSAYLACIPLDSPWGIVACCALVSFATDLGVPAIWAFMQDVGGRSVGTVAGWANMWGNLGASVSSKLLPWVIATFDTNKDWREVFLVCAASYAVAIVAALGMNPRDTIDRSLESMDSRPVPAPR